MEETLSTIIASEEELINEAAEALPHQFSSCTYLQGSIRQAVYLCLTCALPRGICSSCSIACHTKHEQLELFPKRDFRCDCPTRALANSCTLHKQLEPENASNAYGPNFTGAFCRCGRPYDVKTEREVMIQCLACEDWYHESCLNLRERPLSRRASPVPNQSSSASTGDRGANDHDAGAPDHDLDDTLSEASSSALPPGLITDEDYEALICRACVLKNPVLKRWAGTEGVLMVTKMEGYDPGKWVLISHLPQSECRSSDSQSGHVDVEGAGSKRRGPSVDTDMERDQKRARLDEVSCLAPPPNLVAQRVLENVGSTNPCYDLGEGDIFLTEGWRQRWCRCDSCLPSLQTQPYLLEEEETYEPPDDPDAGFSLEELGMRALQRLPRDRAIEGIRAFNEMRDELLQYLRPFAQEGKVVSEVDVKKFFELKSEAAAEAHSSGQTQPTNGSSR